MHSRLLETPILTVSEAQPKWRAPVVLRLPGRTSPSSANCVDELGSTSANQVLSPALLTQCYQALVAPAV